jgi:WD40 repeat protein
MAMLRHGPFCLSKTEHISEDPLPPRRRDSSPPQQTRSTAGLKVLWTCDSVQDWIARLTWSPDGREIATASQKRGVDIWDSQSGKLRLTIPIHRFHTYSAVWSPDGKTLASSHDDRFIRLWNPKNGSLIREIEAYNSDEASIQEERYRDRHEKYKLHFAQKTEQTTSPKADTEPLLFPNYESVRTLAYSPDGEHLAWGYDFGVRIWHTSSNEPAILFREQDRVISLAWSPQGRFIASTSYNESLCIFDTKDRTLRHRLDASYGSGLAWSPDGKLVVAAIRSDIGVWSAESGQLVRVLEGHMSRPRALAFSSDGALLSSKGGTRRATPVESGKARDRYVSDKKVLIWRTDTWNVCGSLSGLPGNYLHCGLAFSPTSSLLATTTLGDKALQVWSFDENRLLKEAGQAWANICRRCAAGPRDFS